MSGFSTAALADGGKAVALSVLMGAVLAFVPLLSLAAVPALPVPAAYVTGRHGFAAGGVAALGAGFLSAVIGGPFTGLLVTLLALAGVAAGVAIGAGMRLLRVFLLLAALIAAGLAGWTALALAAAGIGPVAATAELTGQAMDSAQALYTGLGRDEQQAASLVESYREYAALLPYLLPSLLVGASLVIAALTLALTRAVFARLGQPFPGDFSFRAFRLHFGFAYVMILGLLLQLAAPYLGASGEVAGMVGLNLLVVSELLFFVQGLAIAYYFLNEKQVSRPRRLLVYTGLVLLQLLFSLVSWLGLFDTWLDYRRRFGGKRRPKQQKRQ